MSVSFPLFDHVSRSVKSQIAKGNFSEPAKIFEALKGIDLTILRGERVGLLGRNGAGKSTILQSFAGVYEPSSGSLTVNGSTTSLFEVAVGIDMDASGYENIPLLMAARNIPLKEFDVVARDVEEFTELGEALARPLRTYSAGMRLRIAFAIATYRSSDVLLMDEVIGVGDAYFRDKATKRLNKLIENAGTLVLASHANSFLKAFCKRGLVFSEGRIVFDGDIDDAIEFHAKGP